MRLRNFSFIFLCTLFCCDALYGSDEYQDDEDYYAEYKNVEIKDRWERFNRKVHNFNAKIDRGFLTPAVRSYNTNIHPGVRLYIRNAIYNLREPGNAINHALQGNFKSSFNSARRFIFNSTIGAFGIVDVMGASGAKKEIDTDFGRTLHKYGYGYGSYIVLPFIGPSSTREAMGIVADFVMNPLRCKLDDSLFTVISIVDIAQMRVDFDDEMEALYKNSIDHYTGVKSYYMQYRARD